MPSPDFDQRYHDALHLFIDASAKYPASLVAQAAAVALAIQDEPDLFDPFCALSFHEPALSVIIEAGNTRHEQARQEREPDEAKRVPVHIDEAFLKNLLQDEARLARDFSVLSRESLKEILERYKFYINEEEYFV